MAAPDPARPVPLAELKTLYGYDEWGGRNRLDTSMYVRGYAPTAQVLPRWQLLRLRTLDVPTGPRSTQAIWGHGAGGQDLLRFDLYEFESRPAAHSGLVRVLAAAQSPARVVRRDDEIGDAAFVGENGRLVVFARANLLLVVRNAGAHAVPVEEAARLVDDDLVTEPPAAALRVATGTDEAPAALGSLAPVLGEAARGAVPLELEVETAVPGAPVCVKVYSPTGDLYARKGRLMYRQTAKGEQVVRAYAITGDGVVDARRERFPRLPGR